MISLKNEILSKKQIFFYKENGYLIIPKVLTSQQCDEYLKQIKKHANMDFAAIMNPDRFEFLIAQTFENIIFGLDLSEKINKVQDCKKTAKMTFDIMANEYAVSILEKIQNTKVVGLMSQMLFKEANTRYAKQAWNPHQDNVYVQNNSTKNNGYTTQYITTNFFLNDADEKNGSLYIYPGSHKYGIYESEKKISYREKGDSNPGNEISNKILSKFDKTNCTFKKGDLLVLNGNCIHGSYPNESNISRPLLSVSYISKGEDFVSGKNAQRKEINLDGYNIE